MNESLEKKVHTFLATLGHESSNANVYGDAFWLCEKEIVETLKKHGFTEED